MPTAGCSHVFWDPLCVFFFFCLWWNPGTCLCCHAQAWIRHAKASTYFSTFKKKAPYRTAMVPGQFLTCFCWRSSLFAVLTFTSRNSVVVLHHSHLSSPFSLLYSKVAAHVLLTKVRLLVAWSLIVASTHCCIAKRWVGRLWGCRCHCSAGRFASSAILGTSTGQAPAIYMPHTTAAHIFHLQNRLPDTPEAREEARSVFEGTDSMCSGNVSQIYCFRSKQGNTWLVCSSLRCRNVHFNGTRSHFLANECEGLHCRPVYSV